MLRERTHRRRVYLDTSVIGGLFDEEFADDTRRLFRAIRAGKAVALVSSVTQEELEAAPERVQDALLTLPDGALVRLPDDPEVEALAEAYLNHDVVTEGYRGDATHTAFANFYVADVLTSWNFRHIVNLARIEQFQRKARQASSARSWPISSSRQILRRSRLDETVFSSFPET